MDSRKLKIIPEWSTSGMGRPDAQAPDKIRLTMKPRFHTVWKRGSVVDRGSLPVIGVCDCVVVSRGNLFGREVGDRGGVQRGRTESS